MRKLPKCRRTNRAVIALDAGAIMITEACHVPLDRPGTPRTCYLVANKFGFANCQTVAPPPLRDMQEGRAALAGGTANAQSCPGFRRLSVKEAAAGRVNAVTRPRKLRTGRNTDRCYFSGVLHGRSLPAGLSVDRSSLGA